MTEDLATEDPVTGDLFAPGSFFAALRGAAAADWQAYSRHAFLSQLADGSLPEAAFRYYLIQDYIFLINFARAYALGVYKAQTLSEMRHCQASVNALLETELSLHIAYCRDWGLEEAQVLASAEDPGNLAYTRYVLDRGLAGDFLDLMVALAPCVVGYAEIGHRLHADPASKRDGNPYWRWIETYGGEDYRALGRGAVALLQEAAERRLGRDPVASPRFAQLAAVFVQATRLEADFWQMGLDRG